MWRRFARIASYSDGSIGSSYAVAVEVNVGDDVEPFAAVGGGDDAKLVVVKDVAERFIGKIKLWLKNQTHHKSMALVGERKTFIRSACCRVGQNQTLNIAGCQILFGRVVGGFRECVACAELQSA